MTKQRIDDMYYQVQKTNLGLISSFINSKQDWRLEFSYDDTSYVEYVGESLQKVNTDEQGWNIRKFIYDDKHRVKSLLWCKDISHQ